MIRSSRSITASLVTLGGAVVLLALALVRPAHAQAPDFSSFAGRWIHGELALQVNADGSAELAGSDSLGRLYTADVQFQAAYTVSGSLIAAGRVTHDYQSPGGLTGATIYLGLYPQTAGVGFLSLNGGDWSTVCTPAAPSQLFGSTC
jgi:hypothetical protein